jgi:hypothetical protein
MGRKHPPVRAAVPRHHQTRKTKGFVEGKDWRMLSVAKAVTDIRKREVMFEHSNLCIRMGTGTYMAVLVLF